MRRPTVVVLAVLLCGCPGSRESRPKPTPPPARAAASDTNVLLITIDALRADHLGAYGYRRATSPTIDAFAKEGTVFDQAYTHWPKTRGSFVMMMTGRYASQNGYDRTHPWLLGFNPTLASTLQAAGYATTAVVDNANVDKEYGYAKGFDRYRQIWDEHLATEADGMVATTEDAVRFLAKPPEGRPFFLWLHYVGPHAPYTPPPPFDTKFLDRGASAGPVLKAVEGSFHGGVHKPWEVRGKPLGYYVAQYDGEIAAVDQDLGKVLAALSAGGAARRTLVIVTSDHGESLGEHGYYFDHGEDLFDPCLRIPLIVRMPGAPAGLRSAVLASTLDLLPTVFDAVKVSYPPDLVGRSLLPVVKGGPGPERDRLFAQNDRNLRGTFDARFKLVGTPERDLWGYALYDRAHDPGEVRDAARRETEAMRVHRRELELFLERSKKEAAVTSRLTEGEKDERKMSRDACEQLVALGYLGSCP